MDYRNLQGLQESYYQVHENFENLNEISQKTATHAFARRATDDFETDEPKTTKSGEYKQDEMKRRIEKKFGKAAGIHADSAAVRGIFGRKSGIYKQTEKENKAKLAKLKKEGFDVCNLLVNHLISEGYADSVSSAEYIMVNMSEEWINEIISNY